MISQEIESQLLEYIELGEPDRYWYRETRLSIERVFKDTGEDIDQVIDILAATSIAASLKSNVAYTFRALLQWKLNEPFEGYLPATIQKLDLLRSGEPLDSIKIRNFSEAMKGNPDAVVIDRWMVKAFGEEKRTFHKKLQRMVAVSPSLGAYKRMAGWVTDMARYNGYQPRELQSAIWSGIRVKETGKGNTTRYDGVLRKHLPSYQNKLLMFG